MEEHDNNYTLELIVKVLLGTASETERSTLERLKIEDPNIRRYIDTFTSRKDFVEKYYIYKNTNDSKAFDNFKQRIAPSSARFTNWWHKVIFATTVAATIISIAIFIQYKSELTSQQLADIMPPESEVYLTTANGAQIILGQNNESLGHDINQDGIIAQDKNGTLNVHEAETPSIQTLTVPRGAEYNVTLPDGTEVHLNAKSSISFPSRFSKDVRKVILKGEAYFKVQPTTDKTPFVVVTNDIIVKQYGTEFNINGYQESTTLVTLINGSIGVAHSQDIQKGQTNEAAYTMLSPGFQAVCEPKSIALKAINTEMVTGWHEGLFRFDNISLKQIAKDLERWYDVDIAIDEPLKDLRFTGTISKNESLAHILDAICQSSRITYKADGKTIRIKEKNIISKLISE